MVGPILSILLMGLVPVWGLGPSASAGPTFRIAAPVARESASEVLRTLGNRLSASGVIILDLESGQALYGRSADTPRPMASLTKLMTALLIVENHGLDELVTIPQDIEDVNGNTAHLGAGDQYSVGDLLSALLMMSANDAAITLARYHSGSQSAFVAAMNERARALGLKTTIFANPTGLDTGRQQSSPRDLAWLAMYVLRHPPIAERLSTRGAQIRSRSGVITYLTHTHALLHADTAVRGGKTGTTDAAGECLLSIVEGKDRRYVVVLLRSLDRYGDMRLILDTLTN